MSNHKSIKQHLARSSTPERTKMIIDEWVQAWQREQDMLLKRLGKANSTDDFDAASIAIGELKAVTSKRFQGLRSVINHLTLGD